MIKNVKEEIIIPQAPNVIPNEHLNVYVPTASNEQKGLANFYKEHFVIVDGLVKIKSSYLKEILASNFQTRYDEELNTDNKTVVGSINELDATIKNSNNIVDNSLSKSIRYIRYVAPNALLNGPNSLVSISTVPGGSEDFVINGVSERFNLGDEFKGDFSTRGMTNHVTVNNIEASSVFFGINRVIKPHQYGGQLGFNIILPSITTVEMVQIYLLGVSNDLGLKLYAYGDNVTYEYPLTFDRENSSDMTIYRLHLNKDIVGVRLVQEGENDTDVVFTVKGIELFAPTTEGYYELVQRNNVVSKWDTFDAKTLIENVNAALNDTRKVLSKKGKEGGWPILDGSEKIFAHYIPSIVKTDYEIIDIDWSQIDESTMTIDEINAKINELAFAKLITLSNMEQGDVAALIKQETDEYGYIRGKIIKSWMLLGKSSLGYASPENWYEQSVATAGSSAFAKQSEQSENSVKVGGIAFEGIYNSNEFDNLVNNGLTRDETIYIVEV